MSNPYQSPLIEAEHPRKPNNLALRVLAIVFWVIGLASTSLILVNVIITVSEVPFDISPRTWPTWAGIGAFILTVCVLPAIAFGLLGLGCWQRSWRLAISGLIVLIADGLLIGALVIWPIRLTRPAVRPIRPTTLPPIIGPDGSKGSYSSTLPSL